VERELHPETPSPERTLAPASRAVGGVSPPFEKTIRCVFRVNRGARHRRIPAFPFDRLPTEWLVFEGESQLPRVFEADLDAEELRSNGTKIHLQGQPFVS